jgi:hypothetical protein
MRLLLIFLLVGFYGQAQVDPFTNQRRVESKKVFLKNRLMEGVSLSLRSVDSSCYIRLDGWGSGTAVIGSGDQAIFLLDSTTIRVYSTGVQGVTLGDYNRYSHQYSINPSDIKLLADHSIKAIRKYTAEGYSDISIPEKNQSDFKRTAQLFYSEYRKS